MGDQGDLQAVKRGKETISMRVTDQDAYEFATGCLTYLLEPFGLDVLVEERFIKNAYALPGKPFGAVLAKDFVLTITKQEQTSGD